MPTCRIALSALLLALCLPAHAAEPTEKLLGVVAKITYISADSIFIDAGSEEGLRVGDRVEAVKGEEIVAVLEVTDVASHRAACKSTTPDVVLAIGDRVRFIAHGKPELDRPSGPGQLTLPSTDPEAAIPAGQHPDDASSAPTTTSPSPTPQPAPAPASNEEPRRRALPGSRLRELGISGRVGVRYLAVSDRSGFGNDLSQPALDLRFDARGLGGSPLELGADIRARRTYRTTEAAGEESESRTRVYRLFAGWAPKGSPWRFAVGRQFTPSLSALSLYDGVSAEYRRERWRAGLIAGSQPDPIDQGYSSSTREYGAYWSLREAPAAKTSWDLSTGLIGSYQQGEINREFFYVQGSLRTTRWLGFMTQEVDINRGWRSDAGESTLSPTSTMLTARFRASDALELSAGYDDRRNVRLYLDLVTPETEFDERQRRGVWVGARYRFLTHFRVGGEYRTDTGDEADSDRMTIYASADGLSKLQLGVRTRTTRYTNDRSEGWLHSVSAGLDLGERTHLDVSGGTQSETSSIAGTPDRSVQWLGLDVDVRLARRWLLLGSVQRTDGDDESNDQFELGLSWRF